MSLLKTFQWLLFTLKIKCKSLLFPYMLDSKYSVSCGLFPYIHYKFHHLSLFSSHISWFSVPLNDYFCPDLRIIGYFSAWNILFQMFTYGCWFLPVLIGLYPNVPFSHHSIKFIPFNFYLLICFIFLLSYYQWSYYLFMCLSFFLLLFH